MELDIFNAGIDINNYFVNQLTLSSTLLGLIIATSTFILQSGFSSFEFSRSMFLKYYVRLSKFLFLLLGYNIIICLVFLYFKNSDKISFVLHILFSLIFIKYILDFYSHKGYIITISSDKFNPKKSKIGKYLRYIFNLGLIHVLFIFVLFAIIIYYPISLGDFGIFSGNQGLASTLIAFIFCIISLIRILPQFFNFSEQEYKQKVSDKLTQEIDISQELIILKDTLIKNGRMELESKIDLDSINGAVEVRLSNKKDEAFFVVNIDTKYSNVEKIVRGIESYSYEFFKELYDVHVDINSFVLSYFVSIEGVTTSKTYFIRSKRSELEDLLKQTSEPDIFVKMVKNKVIDELFRGV